MVMQLDCIEPFVVGFLSFEKLLHVGVSIPIFRKRLSLYGEIALNEGFSIHGRHL